MMNARQSHVRTVSPATPSTCTPPLAEAHRLARRGGLPALGWRHPVAALVVVLVGLTATGCTAGTADGPDRADTAAETSRPVPTQPADMPRSSDASQAADSAERQDTAQATDTSAPAEAAVAEPVGMVAVEAFEASLAHAEAQMPLVIESAEAVAERVLAHPDACINVPYHIQQAFAEEVLNRAGGLANALPSIERPDQVTDHDISLLNIRSWEEDAEEMLPVIREHKDHGWMVVLFASEAGAPDDLEVDYLIDNGAADGSAAHGGINIIANCFNAWLWTLEYTSALSRDGRYPGVLMSIFMDGSEEHNHMLQRENRKYLGETDAAIPAGELAGQYLERAKSMVEHATSAETMASLAEAAEIVAGRLNAGEEVKVATCLHMLMSEIYITESGLTAFHGYRNAEEAMAENLDEDDLLVWWGYMGMTTPYEQYGATIAATGADLISSYTTDPEPANNEPASLVHIEQQWTMPDAEIAIPFPPERMAPISGIEQALLFRMFDAAVAERLDEAPEAADASDGGEVDDEADEADEASDGDEAENAGNSDEADNADEADADPTAAPAADEL